MLFSMRASTPSSWVGRILLLAPCMALAAALLLTACTTTEADGITEVTATKAKELVDQRRGQPDFIILDIRTPGEFKQGHIEGAVNIDFYGNDFKAKLKALDKDKTYLLHCRSGNRSGHSLSLFNELGFKDIFHMSRGIRDWNDNHFPVVKGE